MMKMPNDTKAEACRVKALRARIDVIEELINDPGMTMKELRQNIKDLPKLEVA